MTGLMSAEQELKFDLLQQPIKPRRNGSLMFVEQGRVSVPLQRRSTPLER